MNANGAIDVGWVIKRVLDKCSVVHTKSSSPTYYAPAPDIGKNVEIHNKGITHGFIKHIPKGKKSVPPRSLINARVALNIPDILKTAIEVNRSVRPGNNEIEFSHIMVGVAALENQSGVIEYYAVRFVIESRKNQGAILTEANVIGKLHAVNAKKIGSPHAQAARNPGPLATSDLFLYSVADLLNDVKAEFKDTFSNDVYNHFGLKRVSTPHMQGLQ